MIPKIAIKTKIINKIIMMKDNWDQKQYLSTLMEIILVNPKPIPVFQNQELTLNLQWKLQPLLHKIMMELEFYKAYWKEIKIH